MISKHTNLNIIDNSGAKKVQCFHLYKSFNFGLFGKSIGLRKTFINCLGIILGSVKKLKKSVKKKKWVVDKRLKKSEIVHCLIVNTKQSKIRFDGDCLKSKQNQALILNKKELTTPMANRIKFKFPFELRLLGFSKIYCIGKGFY